jgi:DNA-binding NarL/FixJ family response regulator
MLQRGRKGGSVGVQRRAPVPAGSQLDPVKVFILDDHAMLRRGLIDLLAGAGDFEVVGQSGSAQEAIELIPKLEPQVALLDIKLPDGSGIDVCRQLRVSNPQIRALMITVFDDHETRHAATLAGAWAFVTKQVRGGHLLESIRRVASGERLLGPPPSPA